MNRPKRWSRTWLLLLTGVVLVIVGPRWPSNADETQTASRPGSLQGAHLRIARPTDDLEAVTRFYRDGLGFEVLYRFEDHDGFDGVMLGHAGAGYHLEFTHHRGHKVGRAPTDDNLLVFYLGGSEKVQEMVDRLELRGHRPVEPYNPYWRSRAETFEDPDGYRIVLAESDWTS